MSSRSSTLGSLPLGASGSGDSCSSYECLGGWASGGGGWARGFYCRIGGPPTLRVLFYLARGLDRECGFGSLLVLGVYLGCLPRRVLPL